MDDVVVLEEGDWVYDDPDDPVWIHWSSGMKFGWVKGFVLQKFFHERKDGTTHFRMYEILQEDDKTLTGVPSRLLTPREI